jgi:peptidoglycan/xylan/chitin deacetylase (PgdA/CDA1 family)
MRIPGWKSLKQSARWLRSRFINGALILGYHRVDNAPFDSFSMGIIPQHFAEQLEVLHQQTHPMSLPDLMQGLRDNHLPRRAVALTFDDGYADNLYQVKPLLERYQIPATVFVATGYIGREFWWYELERILLSARVLPDRLYLPVHSSVYEWLLDGVGKELPYVGIESLEWKINSPLASSTADDPASAPLKKKERSFRQQLLWRLHKLLLSWSPAERQRAMLQLQAWADVKSSNGPIHPALTHDELIPLTSGGLVNVGAHTVTHPVLSELSLTAQQAEIQQSKIYLEKILGQPVTSFSYPHGSVTAFTQTLVREAGYDCACTSLNDVTRPDSNPFHLPRFWIPDWDGETFSRWLKKWLPN